MKRKQFIGILGNTSLALLASRLPSLAQYNPKTTTQEFVFVEAEQFANHGGWELDQQSMEQMGSPYLLAHGLGIPVRDRRRAHPSSAPALPHRCRLAWSE